MTIEGVLPGDQDKAYSSLHGTEQEVAWISGHDLWGFFPVRKGGASYGITPCCVIFLVLLMVRCS